MKRKPLFAALAALCCSAAAAAAKAPEPFIEDDVGGLPPGVRSRKTTSVVWKAFNGAPPPLESPRLGTLRTRRSGEIAASSWSIGCECLDRDYANFEMYKTFLPDLGVKWARLQSGWEKTERTKGVYDFAWLDAQVDYLVTNAITPWITLCYGNSLYGSRPWLGVKVADVVGSPEGLSAWLAYAETVVSRYRDRVTRWEIWNEPYDQTEAYAKLCAETIARIVKVQPAAEIVISACRYPKDPQAVYDAVKARGLEDAIRWWAVHPYRANPDDSYSAPCDGPHYPCERSWDWCKGLHMPLDERRAWVKSLNPKYDILQGECGCPAQLEFTHALCGWQWTEVSQAKWVLRRAMGDVARGLFSSHFAITDNLYANMLQSFGLIRSDLLKRFVYRRPAYYAMRNVYGFFDADVKPLGLSTAKAGGRAVTLARFEKKGRPIVAAWFSGRMPDDSFAWTPNVTVPGLPAFNDPVFVDLVTGGVWALPKGVRKIPLRDAPALVAERETVELKASAKTSK